MLDRSCPMCGSDNGKHIRKIELNLPHDIDMPQMYWVTACEECGFVFADTKLTEKQLNKYYQEDSIYACISDIQKSEYEECCNLYYSCIEKFCNTDMKIIDIGCGNGNFLRYLKEKDYHNLCGIDPDVKSVERLIESGITAFQGSIYDECKNNLKGKFDVVISTGVLEHLLDFNTGIKNMEQYLNSDGIMFIGVPNAEGFSHYNREIPNYFNQEHINYFTKTSLDMLMAKYGFIRKSADELCYAVVNKYSPELVLCGVYAREEVVFDNKKDESGKRAVEQYFLNIQNREDCISESLAEIVNSKQKIAIWGTGSFARHILEKNKDVLDNVVFFVDNNKNKQGSFFFERKIVSPDELKENPDLVVVICVMIDSFMVEKQIQELGGENKVINLCARSNLYAE